MSLTFGFVFCPCKLCPSLTLYSFLLILFLLLSLPLFSFRLPSDGPWAHGTIHLSGFQLAHILTDPDHHTPGSTGSLLFSVSLSPYICISIQFDASSPLSFCLLLMISALFQVTNVLRRSCGSDYTW